MAESFIHPEMFKKCSCISFFFEVLEFPKNKLNPVKCKNAKGLRVFNIAASTEAAHLQYENPSQLFICKNSSK